MRAVTVVLAASVSFGLAAAPDARWSGAHAAGRDAGEQRVPQPAEIWRRIFARPQTIPAPDDNPLTPPKIELGRALFHDVRLSGDRRRSCATCHDPVKGFADGLRRAAGRDGTNLPRNTPALWNLAWARHLFWDGRAESLEAQAKVPIIHPNELAGNLTKTAAALNRDSVMKGRFARAFRDAGGASPENILSALASYERSLVSPPTKFDHWLSGDPRALNRTEYEGFRLFTGKAGCLQCHGGWRFTDDRFHDIGLDTTDLGRNAFAGASADSPAHKTPGLRGVAGTAPYMHDGSKPSLESVVEHYAVSLIRRPSLATQLKRRPPLSSADQAALVAFLKTL